MEKLDILKNIVDFIMPLKPSEYISHDNRKCWRTTGVVEYYFKKCGDFGLVPHWVSDLAMEASNGMIDFNYCEHDITISIRSDFLHEVTE